VLTRLLIAAAIAAAAVIVARLVAARRSRVVPLSPQGAATVPTTLDRTDFEDPGRDWLVAVFTSETCDSCRDTVTKARPLESAAVAVQEIEVVRDRGLHDKYRIDAVPTLLIADRSGEVRRYFLGPHSATDLWAALAELREPGSVPPRETGTT
jgi:hypothetical protein